MQFELAFDSKPSVFIPYKTHGRSYYLLFSEAVPQGTLISVQDSTDIPLDMFFKVGDMTLGGYGGHRCGYIFYTVLPSMCQATCIVAYSKQWAKAVNNRTFPLKPFGVTLMLRTKNFYVYHKKNRVTLIVNPNLARRIQENLEV